MQTQHKLGENTISNGIGNFWCFTHVQGQTLDREQAHNSGCPCGTSKQALFRRITGVEKLCKFEGPSAVTLTEATCNSRTYHLKLSGRCWPRLFHPGVWEISRRQQLEAAFSAVEHRDDMMLLQLPNKVGHSREHASPSRADGTTEARIRVHESGTMKVKYRTSSAMVSAHSLATTSTGGGN